MRLYQRPLCVLTILFFQSMSWAATLCIQNKESQTYETLDRTKDCVFPDAFNRTERQSLSHVDLTADANSSSNKNTDHDSAAFPTTAHWDLRADDGTVYAALKRWAATAGWQISWEIPVDFPVEILDISYGSFEDSVRRVLTAFKVADYPPYPCFHKNHVVRIVRRISGTDDECQR